MRSGDERLLNPADLPSSLWDAGSKILSLPPALARAYETLIDRHGPRALANSRDRDDSPVGGLTQEKTDEHFAQAFDGSAARAQLAMLDPKKDATAASNAYIKSLAGNRLSLTDAPCGAGAAALAFLANAAALRASGVLPREPLDVYLIGAELSEPARVYAEELLAELTPSLEAQGIFVAAEFVFWDVTDDLRNTDLIRKMTLAAASNPNRLLVVANFNAFLEKEAKKKDAEPQLAELFRHASGKQSVVVWIEPDMNRAVCSLFPWLCKMIKGAWRRFATVTMNIDDPIATSHARFHLPLNPDQTARVGFAVMPIELVRSSK